MGIPARRPRLRVLGTEITLVEPLRRQAERDLGIDLVFETLDFPSAQRKAAVEPGSFDIYDQCFHNLDIVWFWRAIQPIALDRIACWGDVSDLTKAGRLGPQASTGRGDAPVKKLYVQPDHSLGSARTDRISMLPTVHNLDSFAYWPDLFGDRRPEAASWGWLFDREAKGCLALVDEPAIGVFDAALALEARGEVAFDDIGNLSIAEIDRLMALLWGYRKDGHFSGLWRTAERAAASMVAGKARIGSMWSPGIAAVMRAGRQVVEAVPREGYRAWHSGLCLSARLTGEALDTAYRYLNWWLDGAASAVMARQGFYMSVPERARARMKPAEWAYWYDGKPASTDLPGPDGQAMIGAGRSRPGGSYWERASRISVWNTTMDEYNYLARQWAQFAASFD